jgi:hypothetical protein
MDDLFQGCPFQLFRRCEADGNRNSRTPAELRLEGPADPFDNTRTFLEIGLRHHDQELIPSDPEYKIVTPGVVFEYSGGPFQELVPEPMSIGVVLKLEVIQIEIR